MTENFDLIAIADSNPAARNRLDSQDQARFRHCVGPNDLDRIVEPADVVMILTPNHLHVPFAIQTLRAGKPTVIEKPIATTLEDIEALRREVERGAPLYCSDFYVDVRAVPLLVMRGEISADDWRRDLVVGSVLPIDIGEIGRIEACIAEDYPFRFGTWIAEKTAGGVIFDLMVHLFALVKILFPKESLTIHDCKRSYLNPEGPASRLFDEPLQIGMGEAYALLKGSLSPSRIEVSFEVQKQAKSNARYIKLAGSQGTITQKFQDGHPLDVVSRNGVVSLKLQGDRYKLTCLAIRKWLDAGPVPYGWHWNSWAAEQAIAARNWKGTNAGLQPYIRSHKTNPNEHVVSKKEVARLTTVATLDSIQNESESTGGSQRRADVVTLHLERAAETSAHDLARIDAIAHLAASAGQTLLVPGHDHPDASSFRGLAYPHDFSALAPFRHLGWRQAIMYDLDGIDSQVRNGDLIVATGSPTSSRLARRLMTDSLPYRFEELGDERFVKVVSGMFGGTVEKKKGKHLLENTGKEFYTDRDNVTETGWLRRDILIVSRIPSGYEDCDLLLLAGGHGAGTQAIELLFDPRIITSDEIRELCNRLDGHRYWQFVLEAMDIEHNPGAMSLARSARLSPYCPPRVLNASEFARQPPQVGNR